MEFYFKAATLECAEWRCNSFTARRGFDEDGGGGSLFILASLPSLTRTPAPGFLMSGMSLS